MLFSGFSFLFWFLPLCLFFYFLPQLTGWGRSPRVLLWQNAVLFIFSLLFYGWGEPVYVILMVASITTAYFFGFWIEKQDETHRSIGIECFWKFHTCTIIALSFCRSDILDNKFL